MRDPGRIPAILSLLSEVWKLQPDLRLTQLIANIVNGPEDEDVNFYFFEDDALEKELRKKLNALTWYPYDPGKHE